MPALNELYRQYQDRAAFYMVYIQEAHPVDSWQLKSNVEENVLFASTRTLEERAEVAGVCVRDLGIEFPALVDDPDNTTDTAYTAWPDRLYVIDREGRVAYKSAAGPYGFRSSELAEALASIARAEGE